MPSTWNSLASSGFDPITMSRSSFRTLWIQSIVPLPLLAFVRSRNRLSC